MVAGLPVAMSAKNTRVKTPHSETKVEMTASRSAAQLRLSLRRGKDRNTGGTALATVVIGRLLSGRSEEEILVRGEAVVLHKAAPGS
jgi:hypothetical protein